MEDSSSTPIPKLSNSNHPNIEELDNLFNPDTKQDTKPDTKHDELAFDDDKNYEYQIDTQTDNNNYNYNEQHEKQNLNRFDSENKSDNDTSFQIDEIPNPCKVISSSYGMIQDNDVNYNDNDNGIYTNDE